MSDSQEAQEKLREALRDAHARAVAEKRIPTADEITHTHIPYLEAVIEEILRLSHPLPVLDRQATCDTELFGHHIPKGTIAVILNRGPSFTEPGFEVEERLRSPSCQSAKQNRGAREWHPDGMNVFRPERWLTTGDDGCEIFDATAGPTLPFGLGTRGCYGRKLAYLEMRIVFTLLVWQFRLRKCPSELSGYGAVETLTHKPRQCYVNLERLDVE